MKMISRDMLPDMMTIFGFIVAAVFVVFGFYVIFAPQFKNIPSEFRNIFGIIAIAYGIFRSVIIYQKGKARDEEEE